MGDPGDGGFATPPFGPNWAGIPNSFTQFVGTSIALSQYAVSSDGSALTYSSPNEPQLNSSGITLNHNTGLLLLSSSSPVSFAAIQVTITNTSGLTADAVFALNVIALPPVWSGPPAADTIVQGTSFGVAGYVTSQAPPIAFSISPASTVSETVLNAGGITFNHSSGVFSAASNANVLSYPNLLVRATDANNNSTDSTPFTLTVQALSGQVNWSSFATPVSITQGAQASLAFATSTLGYTLTYSVSPLSSLSAAQLSAVGITFTNAGLMIASVSAPVELLTGVALRADDGHGVSADSETFAINVAAPALNALSYLGPTAWPVLSGTQILVGTGVSANFVPRLPSPAVDRQIVLLGGTVQQSTTGPSPQPGSQTLFALDANLSSATCLTIVFPYNGSGVQPGHPNNCVLTYDADSQAIQFLPGQTS